MLCSLIRGLIRSALISLLLATSAFAASSKKRPNFVFIAVDDLNVYNEVLGTIPQNFLQKIYPDDRLRAEVIKRLSPNLERLSQMGLTFDNAFSASPLCGPSRTALMTGVPPHVSGYYQHDKHFRHYESLTDVVTLPQHLTQQGYFTSGLGKIFHKGRAYLDRGFFSDWPDRLFSWSRWIEVQVGVGRAHGLDTDYREILSKYWRQGDKPASHYTRFGMTDLPVEDSQDYVNADFIAELIEKGNSSIVDIFGVTQKVSLPEDKPYFLACGIFAPHLPWVARQEYFDLFPKEEMSLNDELLNWIQTDLSDLSPAGKKSAESSPFTELLEYGALLDGETGKFEAWKAHVQSYLATIAFADRCLEPLVNAIENNPKKDHTVIILWSDHGYHHGDKNRSGKTTLWEGANHCNLIIIDPRYKGSKSGKRTQSLASLQDLYPTITSLAGLEKPSHVHGSDLTTILKTPNKEVQSEILNTFQADNHALRSKKWRYLRFANGDQELYDMQKDPHEFTNLANDPKFSDTLSELSMRLDARLAMQPNDFN